MYCFLKSRNDSNHGEFCRAQVEFLVADQKINLEKVILGVTFMHQTDAKLHFHRDNCDIRCTLSTRAGRKGVNLQLNDNRRLHLCNNKDIKVSDKECSFRLNKLVTCVSKFELQKIVNLKLPSEITIAQQYTILKNGDWPKININHIITLPIQTAIPRGTRSLVIPVKNTAKRNKKPLVYGTADMTSPY